MDLLTRQGETMSVPETIDSHTHRVRWRREPGCRPRGTACERRAARRAGHRRAGQVAHQHGARSPRPTRGRRPGRERGARTKDSRAPAHSLSRHPAPGRDGPEDSYKVLAEVLANGIRDGEPAPGAVAAKAGRRWGQRRQQQSGASAEPLDSAHALDRIVALLNDVGFAPRFIKATGAKTGTADSVNADDATVDAGDATVIEVHSAPSTTSRASTPTSSAPCTWASSRGRWTRCRPHPALSASSPSCARTCAWYTSHPLSSVTPAREHEPRPAPQ
jgi:hypothetical protein